MIKNKRNLRSQWLTRKIFLFAAFFMFLMTLPVFSVAGTVELPKTGQTTCWDEDGDVITCTDTGQDGDTLTGVEWPDPRFTDNGDGTMTDNLTGLVWTQDANLPGGSKNWQEALDYVAVMNAGSGTFGYTDWRLPNVNELESLINAEEANNATWLNGQGFTNVQSYYYWSSTTSSYADSAANAWGVPMGIDYVMIGSKTGGRYVWPVRSLPEDGGQAVSGIWKTGQTTCWDEDGNVVTCTGTGQDGDVQAGVTWPSPRFTDKGDGTVTDNLTGLVWAQDANLPGGRRTWQEALDYVAGLNSSAYLGYTDWLLPNRKELFSLIDLSQYSPALPSGHPFTNVQWNYYWSSTSYASNAYDAWTVYMPLGSVVNISKTYGYDVWPVRAGSGGPLGNSDISVSPASHDFGNVGVGITSTAQSFTVSNAGTAGLVISTISLTGTDSSEFSIQNDNCSGQTVAASGSCTVEAVFSPTVEDAASANLSIPSNDPDTPTLDVSLSGTGGAADTVDPSVIITLPEDGSAPNKVFVISGTAFDLSPSSGLDRIDIQVLDGDGFYLWSDDKWYPSQQWITATGTSSWSYNTRNVDWEDGDTYTVTAQAFDIAGNSSATTIDFTFSIGTIEQAYTTLSLVLSSQTILQNATIDATGKLTNPVDDETDLSGQTIKLTITSPDGTDTPQTTNTYSTSGHYKFEEITGFTQKGTYTIQASFDGTGTLAVSNSDKLSMLVGTSAGYAIIVQGKISSDEGLDSHNKTANRIYETLLARGFVDENIYYFNYDTSQTGVDAYPTAADVQDAIALWAMGKMNGSPSPLYIILHDHGNTDTFYLDDETITPDDLDSWLDTLESGLSASAILEKRIIIYGACYSGSFISALSKPPSNTEGGRVIVTSAAEDEESYKGTVDPEDGIRIGSYFLEEFFNELGRGYSIKKSFKSATAKTETYTRTGGSSANTNNAYFDSSEQHPLLDDDGDGTGSNALSDGAGDGQISDGLYLGTGVTYDTNSANNPAEFLTVTETVHLDYFTSTYFMWATANNEPVSSAWMEIRPPSQILSGTGGSNQLSTDYTKELMLLIDESTDTWGEEIDTFTESGMYEIYYYVKDDKTSEISPTKRSVVYKDKIGNNPPSIFNLISPDYGSEERTILAFEWEASSDPDGDSITYNLLVATDEDFNNIVYKKEEITTTAAIVDAGAGLSDLTTYYWKAQAVDAYGLITDSAQTWSFYTNNTNFGFGYITGIVYDAKSFAPIVGATVKTDFADEDTTKTEGYYIMSANEGTYKVTCSFNGYSDTSFLEISVSDGKTTELNIPMTPSVTSAYPTPDIKANGSDGPLNINLKDNLSVTVKLDSGDRDGENADWWVYATTSLFGTYWYTLDSGWLPSNTPIRVYGGPLFSLPPYTILEMSTLPIGNYIFNFEVDNNMDNIRDGTYTDSVGVTIE